MLIDHPQLQVAQAYDRCPIWIRMTSMPSELDEYTAALFAFISYKKSRGCHDFWVDLLSPLSFDFVTSVLEKLDIRTLRHAEDRI